jgi:MFS family permease
MEVEAAAPGGEASVTTVAAPSRLLPARYRLSIVCFFAAFFGYAQRYGLALAIVRMQVDLDWDRSTQGRVLAAFFLGYMVAQLPAGYAAARVGPRKSIFVGLCCSSLLNLLLPAAATCSPWVVAALRVLQGLAQGILFPGFAALWASWAPPMERSRLDGIPRAGGFCGAMACNAIGGLQCDSSLSPWLFGGWGGVFSLWGVAGLGFAALWWGLVADTPSEACASTRPSCSQVELRYIQEALSEQLIEPSMAATPPCTIYLTICRRWACGL